MRCIMGKVSLYCFSLLLQISDKHACWHTSVSLVSDGTTPRIFVFSYPLVYDDILGSKSNRARFSCVLRRLPFIHRQKRLWETFVQRLQTKLWSGDACNSRSGKNCRREKCKCLRDITGWKWVVGGGGGKSYPYSWVCRRGPLVLSGGRYEVMVGTRAEWCVSWWRWVAALWARRDLLCLLFEGSEE